MWIELLPNPTIMNDPTYFPPKYFAQLFASLGETTFRLFIERDGEGKTIRLLMELDDSIAPSAVEYARTLLKADINQCAPPVLDYKYRLEATLSKSCAFPISHITRQWIDRYAPSSQNQMHLPVPADSLFTSILTRGTAVEVIAKASQRAASEVSTQVTKLQRGKKMKDGLPIPGGDLIERAGGVIFNGGATRSSTKYVEPAKDKKLDAASEKVLSKTFECNVFVYGNSKEDAENTLSSFVSTSMNTLKSRTLKHANKEKPSLVPPDANTATGTDTGTGEGATKSAVEGTGAEAGSGADAGAGADTTDAGTSPSLVFKTISDASLSEPGDGLEGQRQGRKGERKSPPWSFNEKVLGHWVARHKAQIQKYVPAAIVLGTTIVHFRLLSEAGTPLALLIRQGVDVWTFAPELAACGAAGAFLALFSVLVKGYKTVGLSEYELASIFSFPSPGIPIKTSLSTQKPTNEMTNGISGDVKWWIGSR